MAEHIFIKRNVNSDLAVGGSVWDFSLLADTADAAIISTGNIAGSGGEANGFYFTEPNIPDPALANGGDFTVRVNVTTAHAQVTLRLQLARVNSTGVVQTESALTADLEGGAGIKEHTFVDPNLGTWTSGDRLRIRLNFVNSHMNPQSVSVEHNTVDSQVITPWEADTGPDPITGTLAVTEAPDTLSASGSHTAPTFTGSLAVTEQADTLAASGTSSAPSSTGTVAVTEQDDTLAAAGTFEPSPVTGTLAVTEANDILSASGTVTSPGITGSLAVTEGPDTLAASGTHTPTGVTGTLSVTEQDDTLAAAGTVEVGTITGSLSVTEASDTVAAAGSHTAPSFTGTAGVDEQSDTLNASGAVTSPGFAGTLVVTEASDTLAASGTSTSEAIVGSLAAVEQPDTLAVAGTFTAGPVTGSLSVTEAGDSLAAIGTFTPVPTATREKVSYMLRMVRRESRRLRRSRATVTRGTWPDVTTVHADLPVRVRPSLRATTEVESAAETVALHLYDIECAHDIDVRRDDVFTVTASDDPKLLQRHLHVIEVTGDDWQAGRRLVCQESRL